MSHITDVYGSLACNCDAYAMWKRSLGSPFECTHIQRIIEMKQDPSNLHQYWLNQPSPMGVSLNYPYVVTYSEDGNCLDFPLVINASIGRGEVLTLRTLIIISIGHEHGGDDDLCRRELAVIPFMLLRRKHVRELVKPYVLDAAGWARCRACDALPEPGFSALRWSSWMFTHSFLCATCYATSYE